MKMQSDAKYDLIFSDRRITMVFEHVEITGGDIVLWFSFDGISWSVRQQELDEEKVKVHRHIVKIRPATADNHSINGEAE